MDRENELLCVFTIVIIQRKKKKKKRKQGIVSEGLIALVTWNTRGSHSIFKFKVTCVVKIKLFFYGLILL